MIKKQLFSDTIAYIFDELDPYITILFLIFRNHKIFLIDTYCGSKYIHQIKKDLGPEHADKDWVVINTHYHWDHIWGNAAFEPKAIYAHYRCKDSIQETWEQDLAKNHEYFYGEQTMVLPANVFDDSYHFLSENIQLIHTPGHTADSISIIDYQNNALYTGDNLERPIIQLTQKDTEPYVQTLNHYLELAPAHFFASHTLELSVQDVNNSLQYLKILKNGEKYFCESTHVQEIHELNKKVIEA